MSVAAQPWFKFCPNDWQSDEALGMCSAVARALWIECLCVMHKANPYGYLLVNGMMPSAAQLARIARLTLAEVEAGLTELEAAGVFSRTRRGIIYSRRMVRDARKAQTARQNGQNGGNPNLCKDRANPASDNPDLSPKSQSPDSQEKESRAAPSGAGDGAPDPAPDPIPLHPAKELFGSAREALIAATGKSDDTVRSAFGKALHKLGVPADELLDLVKTSLGMDDPWRWLMGAILARGKPKPAPLPFDRVPDDWVNEAFSERKRAGLPEADLDLEARKFVQHMRHRGEHSADWKARFFKWALDARVEDYGHAEHHAVSDFSRDEAFDVGLAAAAAAVERERMATGRHAAG